MNMKSVVPFSLVLLCMIFCTDGYELIAQSLKMKMANKEFEGMRYYDAIPLYEQILEKDNNNDEARIKLGECYRKTKDTRNALQLYSKLAHAENASPKNIWYYAQALVANKEFDEAAKWYGKYAELMPDDKFARLFLYAYEDLSIFYRDSSIYSVRYVSSLNSWQADFSPVYYKNGILFLSSRHKKQIVRTVFELDQSAYLDFYFASDTSSIYTELTNPPVKYSVDKRKDFHDDHTQVTSNDTQIVGHYGVNFLHDSIRHYYASLAKVTRLNRSANKNFHEGPATFTKHQDTVFFTRSTTYERSRNKKRMSGFALYSSTIEKGEWKPAKQLPFNRTNFSTGQPSLSQDNKKLYFASDRPGGMGGVDIYVVSIDHGVFSDPVNVEEINTPNNEVFPYVDSEDNLFFSSDGFPGLGGLDIFYATIADGNIVSVTNMGSPINSAQDDFGIVWDESRRKGFLSSNRKRGFMDDDIYAFYKLCRTVSVYVYDSITQLPLDSTRVAIGDSEKMTDNEGRMEFCLEPGDHSFSVHKIDYEEYQIVSSKSVIEIPLVPIHFDLEGTISSKEDKMPMEGVKVSLINLSDNSISDLTTGKDGKYHFPLELHSSYRVVASKALCGTNAIERSTAGLHRSQTLIGDMEMICTDDIIKIENVYYDFNKHNIRPDAAVEIDKLTELMRKYPDMRIELRSHTDSRASKKYNMKLSANRAQSAIEYLAHHGIVFARMRAAGYGESLPVNKCVDGVKCTEEEHQQNRRTEFKVLSIGASLNNIPGGQKQKTDETINNESNLHDNSLIPGKELDVVTPDNVPIEIKWMPTVQTAGFKPVGKLPAIGISETERHKDELAEAGLAELIEGTEGNPKFLALHRTAPVGTILKIKNEMNNRVVFVRVMGKLPQTALNNKLAVKISKSAYDKLGAIDSLSVEITYYKLAYEERHVK